MTELLKTNEEWRAWGVRDPMFGVAAWAGRNVDGERPWVAADFFELGKQDWQDFLELWNRLAAPPRGSVAEIGCGAGRLTKQLAASFGKVHALDISPDMIAFAKRHVGETNIEWHTVSGLGIPLPESSVDAVFSCHVFQHLPSPAAIETYFSEMSG